MKQNMAGWDRIARIVVGIVLLVLALTGIIPGGWGIASIVVGAVLLLTGIFGWCPLYALFKIKTRKA